VHEPLYYATYLGPEPVVHVGEGAAARGYPVGHTIQIGQADADAIAEADHDFTVEPVPAAIIGTAEETQPDDPVAAIKRNQMLLELD
jgi:hypothetical protein